MKKLLIFTLVIIAVIFVVSCAPEEEPADLNSLSDEELDAAMETPPEKGAVAGQAVKSASAPQRAARQARCRVSGDNLVLTDKSGRSRTIVRRYCQGNITAERICQDNGGYTSRSGEQCLAGCSNGQCVVLCTDSDVRNGVNDDIVGQKNEQGTTRGLPDPETFSPDYPPDVVITMNDSCRAEDGILNEYYCHDNKVRGHGTVCESFGQVCQNGACVAAGQSAS